jgi:predicted AAA+ superfamily ATPase
MNKPTDMPPLEADTLPRFALPRLEEALGDTPVVLIHGPRQCGKTTLARIAATKFGHQYFTFDDENLLRFAQEDPVRFCAELPGKVVLDEVQRVPELFKSIKLEVDTRRKNGRFILTGSANILTLPKLSDSLAGRMEILKLESLGQAEIRKLASPPAFLKQLFGGRFPMQFGPRTGRLALADMVLSGGFPGALARHTERRRREWQANYIQTITERDVGELARIQSLGAVPRLLQFAGAQTAQLFNISKLAEALNLSRPTVQNYITLLERIFLVSLLPPWWSNRQNRLVKTPKIHLADSGLAAAVVQAERPSPNTSGQVLFGHLLETFVYHELRCMDSWTDTRHQFFHYRDKDMNEVDFVLEDPSGRVAGVEVKSAATVHPHDFRGLQRLREDAGKNFACGVILYDGETAIPNGDRLYAVPFNALWQDASA